MKGSVDSSRVACVELLETEPRVASMADVEVVVEELDVFLARTSVGSGGHCLTSTAAVLERVPAGRV